MLDKHDSFDAHEHGETSRDPKSEQDEASLQSNSSSFRNGSSGSGSNFDRVLFKNLVEVVPLLESYMDQKSQSSFTRRAPMICTKTPTKESNSNKDREAKDRKIAQLVPAIKRKEAGGNKPSKDGSVDDPSVISSKALIPEKDREQLVVLQKQVENLQQKLLEKDELLKCAETSNNQMRAINSKINELRHQVAEKESLIKCAHLQLSDVKIKLADKQAAFEKIQWEVTSSYKKVEGLENEMESIQAEKAAFMILFESLTRDDCITNAEEDDILSSCLDSHSYLDDMDENEMHRMEEAREAYISALASAKENQEDEMLDIAAHARLRLQTFVVRHQSQGHEI